MKRNEIHILLQTIEQTLFREKTQDIGLISGKMSAVIFYFHYARFTGDISFRDIANELLDEIQNQLVNCTEKSYRHGIAGIGIAFDYLIENGFIEAEEDFLDDVDKALYVAFMNQPGTGFSLYDGLTGYAWYWLCRINRPYSEMLLSEILFILQNNLSQMSSTELFDVHNFLFEINCMPVFGQKKENFLRSFRKQYLLKASESYPRLINSPAGEQVRQHLLRRYWQIDSNIPVSPIIKEVKLDGSTNLAWEGLYLISVLSPKEKSWVGLL